MLQHPALHKEIPDVARAETSRDLFVDRSTANDRSSEDMCYRAWPIARVVPLRSAPLRNSLLGRRDRPCVTNRLLLKVYRCETTSRL